jgi:glucosamine--fructose-6-phosphate aminotransferase (isomerizing)
MLLETKAAPAAVARLFAKSGGAIDALAQVLIDANLRAALTVARGSSDHAASHLGYLLLSRLGLLVTSLPPSVITLHHAPINADGVAALSFSQSGQSPDLVETMATLTSCGAISAAFVNDVNSPLASAVHHVIDLQAGAERSVAATKSFIAQLAAGLRLYAVWANDVGLRAALPSLPETLAAAVESDWSPAIEALHDADRLFVIGRGASLAIAAEMALKFKEVCGIQAEAFSAAEVKHGPMALIQEGYAVLVLAPRGPAQAELIALADDLRARGARVLLASAPSQAQAELPVVSATHDALDSVSMVQSFYPMVEALAHARGHDPDRPPHLKKVTKTT